MMLRAANQDGMVPGPLLGTEVEISVSGPIARVRVRQRFQNPSREWVEGIYVFPLPGDAAVDHMRVITASGTLEGEIQEKKKAQAAYVKARAQGKRAGLVQWQRPNLFSTAVANIEPGGEVTVEITYQQSLAPDSGAWRLRFPLARVRTLESVALARSASDSDPDSDPGSLVGGPSGPLGHPVRIHVDLAPGFEIYKPTSPHHAIRTAPHSDSHTDPHTDGFSVDLAEGEVEAERDFILNWRALPGRQPQASLFQESWGGRHQALLILTPPPATGAWQASPRREIIFVVDTSGSMAGTALDQARRALRAGIEQLDPNDHFNVLAFSTSVRELFDGTKPAAPEWRKEALNFVDALEVDGSTEMGLAFERALRPARVESDRVRQVVFMTDGGVPGPDALLDAIRRWVGETRIFMVGIGSAPNEHFMRKAALHGRGTYTAIGDPKEVSDAMLGLFGKLGSVVLSEIELEFPSGVTAEMSPARIGDLYRGEPLVVAIESNQPLAWVGVRGRAKDSPWRVTVDGRDAEQRPGVHVLWARRKIAELIDTIRTSGDPDGKATQAATALALEHHLVSPYTSLVAVEKISSRRDHDRWVQKHVPGPVASASAPGLSIRFAQGSTPAALQLGMGAAGLALAWAVSRVRRRWS
jgi:Ca-activated chloride channel family protein